MSEYVWPLVVLAPLLAALALCFAPSARVASWLWISCVPALASAFGEAGPLDVGFLWPGAHWGGDALTTRGWLAFTSLLWGCASVFASGSVTGGRSRTRFWLLWQVALSGNLLLIIAGDALSFYVGFTLMSLSAYGLIVHHSGPGPRRAGRLYLQLALTAEFAVLAGLLFRAHAAGGSLDLGQWQTVPLDALSLGLLLVGFGLKMGFWPLHVWLPLAHPAAPAAASAVLSGAMLKAGVLGLWRFLPAGDPLLAQCAEAIMWLGLFTAFYGVVFGVMTSQAKATLAYSSVSQMGYFLIILALAWRHPEESTTIAALLVLFAVHHGLAKGALFLGAGILMQGRLGSGRAVIAWWIVLAAPALALAGLPLTSGGAAKSELKHLFGDGDFGQWLLLLKLGSAATLVLLLRALALLWQKQVKAEAAVSAPKLLAPWALLSLASLVLPWVWPAMREALFYSFSLANSWALVWPLLLGTAIAAVGVVFRWQPPRWVAKQHHPVVRASLALTRVVRRPPLPPLESPFSDRRWRQRERRWNRFWQSGSVKLSAWLIGLLLLAGWLL